jgi:hypothetical protein
MKKDADRERYRTLAARSNTWYQLLWEVPLFAFTAQAFTFTIALDPDATRVGRLIACTLSVLISLVSLVTLVRQRKADRLDSKELARLERQWGWSKDERLHGRAWADRRAHMTYDWRWLDLLVGRWKLTGLWAVAFLVLLALAGLVVTLEFAAPGALRHQGA